MIKNFYHLLHTLIIIAIVFSNNIYTMHFVNKRIATKKYYCQVTKPQKVRRYTCLDGYRCYRCSMITLQRINPTDFDKELSICCAPEKLIFDILPQLVEQGDSKRITIALKYDDKMAWISSKSRNTILDGLEKIAQIHYEKVK